MNQPSPPAEMARCQNPTAEMVRDWFEAAGTNTGRAPGAGPTRQDYPPPSAEICERVAHMLAGLDMWNQPRPSKWPKPEKPEWWGAARWAWVAAAWGWKDAGGRGQPFRINYDSEQASAIVHFVMLALAHFNMNRSKSAISKALKHWKRKAESEGMGGNLAFRGPGIMVVTTEPSSLEWGRIIETLKTKRHAG